MIVIFIYYNKGAARAGRRAAWGGVPRAAVQLALGGAIDGVGVIYGVQRGGGPRCAGGVGGGGRAGRAGGGGARELLFVHCRLFKFK
jgi:hypothetical protein